MNCWVISHGLLVPFVVLFAYACLAANGCKCRQQPRLLASNATWKQISDDKAGKGMTGGCYWMVVVHHRARGSGKGKERQVRSVYVTFEGSTQMGLRKRLQRRCSCFCRR